MRCGPRNGRFWCAVAIGAACATGAGFYGPGLRFSLAAAPPTDAAEKPADAQPAAAQADPATKRLLSARGKFERSLFKLAAQEYEDFLKQYPTHAQATTARYALAVCRYRLAEYPKAIELLEQVMLDAKFAQRDEALAVLGHSHLATNSYDKALAAFDKLLVDFPQSKQVEVATLNRAQVLYLADKKDQALAAAQQYLAQFPKGADRDAAMYFLALSQRGLNQNSEATKTLTELLAAAPETRYRLDATLLLGQSLEADGKLDAAAEQYRAMIKTAPAARLPDAHYSLGVVLYKSAKYDEAIKELAAVVKDYPAHAYAKPAQLQLGRAQLAAGNLAEARATFNAVATADPTRANDARYGLAQADMSEKKWDTALVSLEALLKGGPAPANLPQIQLDHAVALLETGKFAEAAAEFAAFRTGNPKSPQALEATYREAFAQHKLSKYEESLKLVQQVTAAENAGDYAIPATELAAENLFLLGTYPEAVKLYTTLASETKDLDRKTRFTFRLGQSAYYAQDYKQAVTLLSPLAADPKVAQAEELKRAIFLLGDAQLQQGNYKEAAAALATYAGLAAPADKLEAQFKLGLAQLRGGDAASAESTLSQVSAGAPDSPWVVRAQFEQGQLLYKQGKRDLASPLLTKVLAAKPPEELAAPATYLLGWVDYDNKKFPDAAAKWGAVVQSYPKHELASDAAFQRGAALQEAGESEAALAALQAYLKADVKGQHVARARQLSAAAMTKLGRGDEALKTLADLAADPKAGDTVLYDLAWAQRDQKDAKASAETYRRLLKEHADSKLAPAVRTELAELLYNDKGFDAAAELLEQVVSADGKAAAGIDPATLSAATYRLAWTYEKMGQRAKSASLFEQYAKANPGDTRAAAALLQAGLGAAEQGKFEQAAASLSQMLQRFPEHEQASIALLKLGEVQAELSAYPASLKTFADFLGKYPKDQFAYRAHFGMGWASENSKQYEPARAAYLKVIDTTNTEWAARAQFQIGETYLAEGKFEEAVAALLAVEDVYAYPKWSARALLEAGKAFEGLKDSAQAELQYTQIVAKYKDAPEAELASARLKTLKGG